VHEDVKRDFGPVMQRIFVKTCNGYGVTFVLLFALVVVPIATAQEGSLQEAEALDGRARQLYEQGHYNDAIPMAQRALTVAEKALGPEDPARAYFLNSLAQLYRAIGAYAEAEPLYKKALSIREKVLGPEHPDTATSLSNLAQLYGTTGTYTKAEPLFQRALAIREKALGRVHPDTAQSLNDLGVLYRVTGSYTKAEPLLKRALAITEKALGPEHPAMAGLLNNLAELYRETGAYPEAERLYHRALVINEKARGPTHPTTAESLNNLAYLYDTMGAYTQAEPLYQRALVINEEVLGSMHPATATVLTNLAGLYETMGAYARAEPLYQRAVAINETVFGSEHPETATSLNNLAYLYDTMGAYTQAEPLYQRALAIYEDGLGSEHQYTATALNNLAGLYDTMGAYAQAEPLYERALAIREKVLGPEHPDTANLLNNLGVLYQVTGAYAQAEPLYQRALMIREKVLGPEHPRTADSLNNLAELYRATGAYAASEPLYQKALAIREKVLGSEHPDTAGSLNNLGLLYGTTEVYTKAESLLQRALSIYEKGMGLEHPYTATSFNNLADLYSATGAYAKAGPLYQRALAINEKILGSEHPTTATSLDNLADLSWVTGNQSAAVALSERAQAIREKNTAVMLLSGSEIRKQKYLQQFRWYTFGNISMSLLLAGGQATQLGLTSVLQAKGRVLDAMADSVGRLRQSVKPDDRALLEQLVAVAQQSSTLIYQSYGRFSPDVYRQRVDALATKQTQLEAELSTRNAAFRQQVAPITLAAVQAALSADSVLVEWYRYHPYDPKATKKQRAKFGKARYVAYVLKGEGEPAVVDVGDAETIEQLIYDFRSGLGDPANTYVKQVAMDLSDKVMKPLHPLLRNAKRLLVSPDGALNLIPFGALRDESGTYLAMRYEITYLTSGRDLVRVGTPTTNSNAVVVANPDYGRSTKMVAQAASSAQPSRSLDLDRGGMTFTPLPGTVKEANVLTPLLKVKKEDLLTHAQATEAKVKHLKSPRILHVATHGFFLKDNELPVTALRGGGFAHDQDPVPLGENPLLRSGLALAGANLRRSGAQDDGILTAAEVAQMDLRGTQLVVLSACETGVGDVQNGEGVYGLRRALVLAGAETQVASLWKVPDAATKDLMVEYYQRLLQGEGRSAALREAQRTMIKSKTRSHPYYWAAFVPIGNWTPLTQRR
jgi:CHAT domain-containing protein/Tfp pilus assembly protein PilF